MRGFKTEERAARRGYSEHEEVKNLLVEVRDRVGDVRRMMVRGREAAVTESEVGARVRRFKKVKGHRSLEGRR